jgi:hypothetical protein
MLLSYFEGVLTTHCIVGKITLDVKAGVFLRCFIEGGLCNQISASAGM